MDIEIELNLTLTPPQAQQIRERLRGKTELIALKATDKFGLRPTAASDPDLTVEVAIQRFLGVIEPIASLLGQTSSVLRVGAFFSESEAAAFNVLLSSATVQSLARYQIGIDVTSYPCSDA